MALPNATLPPHSNSGGRRTTSQELAPSLRLAPAHSNASAHIWQGSTRSAVSLASLESKDRESDSGPAPPIAGQASQASLSCGHASVHRILSDMGWMVMMGGSSDDLRPAGSRDEHQRHNCTNSLILRRRTRQYIHHMRQNIQLCPQTRVQGRCHKPPPCAMPAVARPNLRPNLDDVVHPKCRRPALPGAAAAVSVSHPARCPEHDQGPEQEKEKHQRHRKHTENDCIPRPACLNLLTTSRSTRKRVRTVGLLHSPPIGLIENEPT